MTQVSCTFDISHKQYGVCETIRTERPNVKYSIYKEKKKTLQRNNVQTIYLRSHNAPS